MGHHVGQRECATAAWGRIWPGSGLRYADLSYEGDLLIMQSNGGAMSMERSRQFSIHTVLSGPAGGATAALQVGKAAGFDQPGLV